MTRPRPTETVHRKSFRVRHHQTFRYQLCEINSEVLLTRAHYLLAYMPRESVVYRISGSARAWTLSSILKQFRNGINVSLYKMKFFFFTLFFTIHRSPLWSIAESNDKKNPRCLMAEIQKKNNWVQLTILFISTQSPSKIARIGIFPRIEPNQDQIPTLLSGFLQLIPTPPNRLLYSQTTFPHKLVKLLLCIPTNHNPPPVLSNPVNLHPIHGTQYLPKPAQKGQIQY